MKAFIACIDTLKDMELSCYHEHDARAVAVLLELEEGAPGCFTSSRTTIELAEHVLHLSGKRVVQIADTWHIPAGTLVDLMASLRRQCLRGVAKEAVPSDTTESLF